MVTVTESARQLLKRIVDDIDDPDFSLRLAHGGAAGQFDVIADKERDGDQVVEHDGDTVLLIGSELSNDLEGATIDCPHCLSSLY